jgi:hypothetical protein
MPTLAGESHVCVWSAPGVHDAACVALSLKHKGEGESEALRMEESAATYRDTLGETLGAQLDNEYLCMHGNVKKG